MPVEIVESAEQLTGLRESVGNAAQRTLDALRALCELDPIDALARIRFTEFGRHPLEDRSLNLVEQLNQMFTYLASFAAADEVARRHPDAWPIRLNLGTASGSDLESVSASVAAEVFSAVRPDNNGKLAEDIAKVGATQCEHRYVFFYCPGEVYDLKQVELGVSVVPLSEEQVLGPLRRPA